MNEKIENVVTILLKSIANSNPLGGDSENILNLSQAILNLSQANEIVVRLKK